MRVISLSLYGLSKQRVTKFSIHSSCPHKHYLIDIVQPHTGFGEDSTFTFNNPHTSFSS